MKKNAIYIIYFLLISNNLFASGKIFKNLLLNNRAKMFLCGAIGSKAFDIFKIELSSCQKKDKKDKKDKILGSIATGVFFQPIVGDIVQENLPEDFDGKMLFDSLNIFRSAESLYREENSVQNIKNTFTSGKEFKFFAKEILKLTFKEYLFNKIDSIAKMHSGKEKTVKYSLRSLYFILNGYVFEEIFNKITEKKEGSSFSSLAFHTGKYIFNFYQNK